MNKNFKINNVVPNFYFKKWINSLLNNKLSQKLINIFLQDFTLPTDLKE